MPHVFTYGSLMVTEVWQTVVRGTYQSGQASVHNFKRSGIRGQHYPAAYRCAHAAALFGVIYFDVNRADLLRLDHFEGNFYQRQATCTHLESGGYVQAQLFVLKRHYRHLATGRAWSLADFQTQHQRQFIARYTRRMIAGPSSVGNLRK